MSNEVAMLLAAGIGACSGIIGQILMTSISNTQDRKRYFFEKQLDAYENLKYKIDNFRTSTDGLEAFFTDNEIGKEELNNVINYAYSVRHLIGEDIFIKITQKMLKWSENEIEDYHRAMLSPNEQRNKRKLSLLKTNFGAHQRELNNMINKTIEKSTKGFWEYDPDFR